MKDEGSKTLSADGLEVVGKLRYFKDYPDSPHSHPGWLVHQFVIAQGVEEVEGEEPLCRRPNSRRQRGEGADMTCFQFMRHRYYQQELEGRDAPKGAICPYSYSDLGRRCA